MSSPPPFPPKPDGFNYRMAPSGFCVVEIDYWADPDKRDPAFADKLRRAMGETKFRREFLRDWDTGEGDIFYPEFHTWGGRQTFVRAAPGVMANQPVYRGWDFGIRRPSCMWLQYSLKQDLLWVMREIMPEQIHTEDFRDLVLYLSGQMDLAALHHKTLTWVEKIRETPGMPEPPWFVSGAVPYQFIDYAGPEAYRRSATVSRDAVEKTDVEILAAGGIELTIASSAPKARARHIRRLLRPPDEVTGLSGLVIDPACPILIKGFAGGITHPVATKLKPYPDADEPRKDGYFENVHDALGYAAVNVVPAVDPRLEDQIQVAKTTGVTPRGRPTRVEYDDDLGFYELLGTR